MKARTAIFLLLAGSVPSAGASAPSFAFVPGPVLSGNISYAGVIGDFNGDGKPDIATVSGTQTVTVFLGDGQGGFGAAIPSKIGAAIFNSAGQKAVAADVNGDGKADLVLYTVYTLPPLTGASITVLLGQSDGTLVVSASYPAAPLMYYISGNNIAGTLAVADLNGDGHPDLAVVGSAASTVDIRLGAGDGTFGSSASYPCNFRPTNYSFVASALAIADLNGDGVPDVVVSGGFSLSELFGVGDGTFQPGVAIPVPSEFSTAGGFVTADFNGDGRADLALIGGVGAGDVCVLLNLGGGAFSAPATYSASTYSLTFGSPTALVASDLTGDGIPDLVMPLLNNTSGTLSGVLVVLPGNGDGTFQSVAVETIAKTSGALDIGDLNGDGRPDLVLGQRPGRLEGVAVLYGAQAPFLRANITHNGNFTLNQTNAAFALTVSNAPNANVTSGIVTVNEFGGTYDDVLSISGPGWTCDLNAGCTRSDALLPGASYPPITVQVQISASYPANVPATNTARASGGGSATTQTTDSATVLPYITTCTFAVNSPHQVSFGSAGGQLDFSYIGSSVCPVQMQSAMPWITFLGSPLILDVVSIAANNTGAQRTGTIDFVSPTGWSDQVIVTQSALSDCPIQFDQPRSIFVGAAGGAAGSIHVITSSGCKWSVTSNVPWVTAQPSAAGGDVINLSVTANIATASRSGTITVSGQSLTIYQSGTQSPAMVGALPHLAVGGGWNSSIQLVNTSASLAQTALGFYGDSGNGLTLPLSVVEDGFASRSSIFNRVLEPYSTLEIDNNGTGSLDSQTGWSKFAADPGVSGYIRFDFAPTGQEALVPLETRNAPAYILAFDNTGGLTTGVAIANIAPHSANVNAIIRDESGTQIGSGSIALPASGHSSFVLTGQFAITANRRGTVEFDTPAGGQISVLGIRFRPPGTITTIPVLAQVTPGSGSMTHFVSGGGWISTITLVNTGAASGNAHLAFFDDAGAPVAVPIAFPQTASGAVTAATLDETLAGNSMLLLESSGVSGSAAQSGSVQLSTNGNVSAFMMFRWAPSNQEAVVPLETRTSASYLLAFDNTNGVVTGVAVANILPAGVAVPVIIRDDTGAQIGSSTLNLPPNGHTAFLLNSQYPVTQAQRGTIELNSPVAGRISVLGLRYTAAGALTSIPVMTP